MVVLAVPDLHCPWHHPGALDFLSGLRRIHRPDRVVLLGDEIDAAAFSRFPKDPDLPSAGEELRRAREALKPFFKLFRKALVCESNHAARPWRRALESGSPAGLLRGLPEALGAPRGWRWAQRWTLDGVLYIHGEGFSGRNAAITAAERFRRNVVMGHVHAHAGVQYSQGVFDSVWGVNAGALVDADAPAFNYGRHLASRPVLGAAVIHGRVPQFVPMGLGR